MTQISDETETVEVWPTAVVTGAASGIGRAVTMALLRDRWRVLAVDRNAAGLDQLSAEAGSPGELTARVVDLANVQEIVRIVAALPAECRLRGLVCSAAVGDNTPFLDVDLDKLRSVLEINFVSAFALCQAAARRMAADGGGAIVNISSVSGLRANAGRSTYGSSKAALEMLSKIMALELAPLKVRVNTVAPGPTLTAMAAALHVGPERNRLLRAVPQGRYGAPEEIAEGVAFLLDARRSGYVTGHTLCVDGGMFAAGAFEPRLGGEAA